MSTKTYFPRITKALAFGTTVYTTYTQLNQLYLKYVEWAETRRDPMKVYSVSLDFDDQIFSHLMRWLYEENFDKGSIHHVFVENNWDEESESWKTRCIANIESFDNFTLPSGVVVKVKNQNDKKKDAEDATEQLTNLLAGPALTDNFLVLETNSKNDHDELIEFFSFLLEKYSYKESIQYLRMADKDRFSNTSILLKRSMDTVFFAEGVLQDIVEDLELFKGQKEKYINFGIPYHRGYLLEGPPGTGKTSVVRALATEYNMNVYTMSLNDLKSDRDIMQLFSNVAHGSIVLIEDIDGFGVTDARADRSSNTEGLSISGLLNALDGVQTLHDCIVIMTSNHPENLDPALMRPGRIDRTFHIGYVDDYALRNMIRMFTGEDHVIQVNKEIVPVEIIEIFKRNILTPQNAIQEVKELVS